MKIIIGLGNPGDKYEKTRHNIGFRMIDEFLKPFGSEGSSCSKFNAEVMELSTNNHKLLTIKPQTFMNLSGGSVQQFVNFYKLDVKEDILVCFDDKDLIFGKLRERSEGGSGGHNGIKSLIKHLGTEQFHRLKFGVGHEEQDIPTDAFVLQKFSAAEEEQIPGLLAQCTEKMKKWINS